MLFNTKIEVPKWISFVGLTLAAAFIFSGFFSAQSARCPELIVKKT
jgi:hypothetical protein